VDFAVHAGFADASRNLLRDLASEIYDEDGVLMRVVLHGGRLKKEASLRNGARRLKE
jgi:hypothetical protein